MLDGVQQNRMFTEFSIRMDSKEIKGNLEKALQINSEADKNNVSEKERDLIREKLRTEYMTNHPLYRKQT